MSEILKLLNKKVELKSEVVEFSDASDAGDAYDKVSIEIEAAIKLFKQLDEEAKAFDKKRKAGYAKIKEIRNQAESYAQKGNVASKKFKTKAKDLGVAYETTKPYKALISPPKKESLKAKERFNSEIASKTQIPKL